MDKKKRAVSRKRLRENRKTNRRFERLAELEASLDKGFSGWEFSTSEKRRAGLLSLLDMALCRLLIEDVETMTRCSDELCLDVAAMCHKLLKMEQRSYTLI